MSPKASARERILDSAEQVVLEAGASHMTMDAVALKAGVSKGGLIYHFPSQRDLLQAMLKRFMDLVETQTAQAREQLPESPAREIKAYILAWFPLGREYRRTASAVLATITREPELLQAVRATHAKAMADILKVSSCPELAMILTLASEGMWMSELLDISPLTDSQRGRLKRSLLKLADEWLGCPARSSKHKSVPCRGKKSQNTAP
jgi:AcrR family transcriptional regulator